MKPNYSIIRDTSEVLLIRDDGPWDKHKTVTNGVEDVVAELAGILNGRHLECIDSDGQHDQIIYEKNRFIKFASVQN